MIYKNLDLNTLQLQYICNLSRCSSKPGINLFIIDRFIKHIKISKYNKINVIYTINDIVLLKNSMYLKINDTLYYYIVSNKNGRKFLILVNKNDNIVFLIR